MAPIRICIAGSGRMSRAIQAAATGADDLVLSGVWTRSASGDCNSGDALFSDDLAAVLGTGDVLIDFTLPAASPQVFAEVIARQTPLVCGVSGLDPSLLESLADAARVVPVVYDRNMSRGVAVLKDLVGRSAASLGPDFSVSIHETHHVHKLDAPSGTALKLGEAVAEARGQSFEAVASIEDPEADSRSDAIRFFVERRGEVPGDHEVVFSSATETLRLAHSVTTRDVFAAGALSAARWIIGQSPGLYSMQDVLNLGPRR